MLLWAVPGLGGVAASNKSAREYLPTALIPIPPEDIPHGPTARPFPGEICRKREIVLDHTEITLLVLKL